MHFEPGFGGGLGGVTLIGALKYYKKKSKNFYKKRVY